MNIKVKQSLKTIYNLLRNSVTQFINDDAIKLSASLSYYTIFSLPPLIIIIITLVGYFFGVEAIRGEVYGQIKDFVGNNAAVQIQETIKNIQLTRDTPLATTIGIIALAFGATGVFNEVQTSINLIWGIKIKPAKGIIKLILNRLISFSMIIVMGFLLLVSLLINTLLDILSLHLQNYFSHITVSVFYVLNVLLVFSVITVIFMTVFKVLPDGKVHWKDSLIGAAFTALLFMVGKFAISEYLGNSSITSVYGAAGSVIVILLWVYYSSIILYFGAEFTQVYATTYGKKIVPNNYSVKFVMKEVESTGS